jgi:hypothetical protein
VRLQLRLLFCLTMALQPNGSNAHEYFMTAQRSGPMAPIRDPDVTVHEELDGARRSGTVAAYDLFLARHPDHPLAQIARRERALVDDSDRAPRR